MRGKTERFYQKLLESQNNNNNKGRYEDKLIYWYIDIYIYIY